MASTITKSTVVDGVVVETPAALYAQARKAMPSISEDAYALARIIASEGGSRPLAEQEVIAGCDYNRAKRKGRSIAAHARGADGRYGKQGSGGRVQSTRLDPSSWHVLVAQSVIAGRWKAARGAERYFNPRVQWACFNKPGSCGGNHQSPLAVLERWCFGMAIESCGRDAQGRYVCRLGPRRAPAEEWVGPIDGIDPWQLLALRAPTSEHAAQWEAARKVIEEGMKGRSAVYRSTGSTLVAAAVAVGGAVAVAAVAKS